MRRTVVLLAGATVAVVASCRAPTQARLLVTTPARCSETNGVAITAKAAPLVVEQAVDSGFVSATATACEQRGALGDYGDLVLAPGADTGAVVVVAGYGATRAETCKPANKYKGCIVARRAFSYLEHTTITIPVSLDPDCVDVPCDALTTCKSGRCVDARVNCTESSCTGESLPPPPGSDGGADAAIADATGDTGASDARPDVDPGDGSTPGDGGADGATGSGMEGRCVLADGPACGGDAGATSCGVGASCCAYGAFPACKTPGTCLGVTFCCDGPAACGPGELCCGQLPSMGVEYKCQGASACPIGGYVICKTAADCPPKGGLTPTCLPFASSPFKQCSYN